MADVCTMLLTTILPAILCTPPQECSQERPDGRILCHLAPYAVACELPKPAVQYSCVKPDGTSYIWEDQPMETVK